MQNCQEIRLPICFMKKAWLKYLENIGKYHLTWQVWVVLGVKFPWKLTATAVFQVLLINKLCVLPTNEGLKLRSLSNLSFSYDQSMVEDQSTNKKRKKKKKAPEKTHFPQTSYQYKGIFWKMSCLNRQNLEFLNTAPKTFTNCRPKLIPGKQLKSSIRG